jgi:hypothetical protein
MKKNLLISLLLVVALLITGCATFSEQPESGNRGSQSIIEISHEQEAVKEIGHFQLVAYNEDGEEIWREVFHNSLSDGGEQSLLDCYLRGQNCPTTFYLRLSNPTNCGNAGAETSSLATVASGEPATNGYAAKNITRNTTGWPTLALDSGDYKATAATQTFNASGGSWGPVSCAFIATSSDNTGVFVASGALSTSRTLTSGESLQVVYGIKIQ